MGFSRYRLYAKFLILLAAFFLLSIQIPDDPDFGVHLGVGRFILENKAFPRTDLFSFSLPNHPYVYHSWLSQLVMTLVYDKFGLLRMSLVWTGIGAIGVYWLYRICLNIVMLTSHPKSLLRRSSGQAEFLGGALESRSAPIFFWIILAFLVVTALVFSSIGVRPQMFTFLFLVMEMWILLRWRKDKGNRKNQGNWGIFWLVPLFWIWANMHLGFIVGFLILGGFLLIERLIEVKGNRGEKKTKLLLLLLSAAATLVNPYGIGLYRQAWAIATNPFNTKANLEWVPLLARGMPHWVFAGVVMLLFVFVLRRRKVDWTLGFLSLILFWGALKSTRVVLPFMVVFLPFISPFLARLPSPATALQGKGKIDRLYFYLLILLIPLAVLARGLTNSQILAAVVTSPAVLADRQNYPWGAVQYIETHPVSEHLLNYFNWGGYLVWQMPQRRVFETGIMDTFRVDGRLFLQDYFDIVKASFRWKRLMDKYAIEVVLLPPDEPLVQLLKDRPEWQVVYQDDISVLLVKRWIAQK